MPLGRHRRGPDVTPPPLRHPVPTFGALRQCRHDHVRTRAQRRRRRRPVRPAPHPLRLLHSRHEPPPHKPPANRRLRNLQYAPVSPPRPGGGFPAWVRRRTDIDITIDFFRALRLPLVRCNSGARGRDNRRGRQCGLGRALGQRSSDHHSEGMLDRTQSHEGLVAWPVDAQSRNRGRLCWREPALPPCVRRSRCGQPFGADKRSCRTSSVPWARDLPLVGLALGQRSQDGPTLTEHLVAADATATLWAQVRPRRHRCHLCAARGLRS
jgi:hypothetical protein